MKNDIPLMLGRPAFCWLDEHPYDRFWRSIRKDSDCWFWLGTKNPEGYGIFFISDERLVAHRFMLYLYGKNPNGFDIHHVCENKSCVNPDHLQILSRKEHSEIHKK